MGFGFFNFMKKKAPKRTDDELLADAKKLYAAHDDNAATQIILQLAEKDMPEAQYLLAVAYQLGRGIEKNSEMCRQWLQKSVEKEYPEALHLFATILEQNGLTSDAETMYMKAAAHGSRDAMRNLAEIYEKEDDINSLIYPFVMRQCAADLGDADSAYKVGCILRSGSSIVGKDDRSAFYMFQKAARFGHTEAQYILAALYYNGVGTEQNLEQAAHWAYTAANAGHVEAQYLFGMMCGRGEGVLLDVDLACTWLKKAAAQGHQGALDMLDSLNKRLLTGKKSGNQLEYALAGDSAKNLSPEEQYRQGMAFYKAKDYIQAFAYLKQSCDYMYRNHINDGLAALGSMYENGLGTNEDQYNAKMYYEMAMIAGSTVPYLFFIQSHYFLPSDEFKNALSAFDSFSPGAKENPDTDHNLQTMITELQAKAEWKQNLEHEADTFFQQALEAEKQARPALYINTCYRIAARLGSGKAIVKLAEQPDLPENTKNFLYELAAYHGNADAMYALFKAGEESHSTEQYFWLGKAGKYGQPDALFTMGEIYYANEQMNDAVEFMEDAARQDQPEACMFCYMAYNEGKGVEKDQEKAMVYLKKAASLGNCDAQALYGRCLETGDGVEEDPVQAAEWYRTAAINGSVLGSYYYGSSLFYGKGCKKNKQDAAFFFEKAAKEGHDRAQYIVGIMYLTGDGVPVDKEKAKKWLSQAAFSKDSEISRNAHNAWSRL